MISSERMDVIDANARYLGVSTAKLMESAGSGVARHTLDFSKPSDVLVLAGRGNNGGDAMVAARFLESEADVELRLMGRGGAINNEITRDNYEILANTDVEVTEIRDSEMFGEIEHDVVIDGMLGTGVHGGLREPVATAVNQVNEASDRGTDVVSVDVPTGLDPDDPEPTMSNNAVKPDLAVTFHDYKPIHDGLESGVRLVDIGIPEAASKYVGEGDLKLLNHRLDSHKGDNGEILVVGGGPYTGAPALSSTAALRSGCDLVHVASPQSVARDIQGYSPNLIVHSLDGEVLTPGNVDEVNRLADNVDSVVVGPGLGDADKTIDAVTQILENVDRAVVDADAIAAIDEIDRTDKEILITPHAGELGQFVDVPSDTEDRADIVKEFSRDFKVTTVLKGRHDIISDGSTTRISRTGNPGMTVGGTGDVLAGISGFLSTQLEMIDAGCIAVFLNGRAGDHAYNDSGYGLTATDLVDCIPRAFESDG